MQLDPKFQFIDLFAGIGGFHAAGKALGGECVYAVEIDPAAADIYEKNWGHRSLGDITEDSNEYQVLVPDHDLLFAGFPCQPFSKSGAQFGMSETRGTLFWNIARIIEVRMPSIVLLENVRNLAGPRHLHEWEVIIRTLRELGYRVSSKPSIFSPHLLGKEFGGRPQTRDRVFIAATKIPEHLAEFESEVPPIFFDMEDMSLKKDEWDLAKDLPLDLGPTPEGTELSEIEIHWINAWDAFVRKFRSNWPEENLPTFPIWADDWCHESELNIPEGTPQWKENFLRRNANFYSANHNWLDKWAADWGLFTKKFPPSRRKFEWQAQGTATLWECVMHFRPSGIRAKRATYLPALVAITQTSIIGPLRRRLSIREAARLQGFPEWFSFEGQKSSLSYKQLGNGVSIGVVWHALKEIARRDYDLLSITNPGLLEAIQVSVGSPDFALSGLDPKRNLANQTGLTVKSA